MLYMRKTKALDVLIVDMRKRKKDAVCFDSVHEENKKCFIF